MFLLKFLGLLCVALGTLGVFLPILPTTPFLLLAIYLFSKSAPHFTQRLKDNYLLGPYLKAYYLEGAKMTVKQKVKVIIVLWLTLLISIFVFTDLCWVRIVLGIIGIGVSIHIGNLGVRKGGDLYD